MIFNCGYDILLNSNTLFYTIYLLCAVLGLDHQHFIVSTSWTLSLCLPICRTWCAP